MATQTHNRLTQLPGFDTAPDVYETGRSSSLSNTSSSPTPSAAASDTSNSEDEEEVSNSGYGVSRRRLYPERARSRFGAQSRGVGAEGLDVSDRVDGRRRGLSRRKDGVDREEEGLEAKIARLKREVEECRAEAEKEDKSGQEGGMAYLEQLGKMMSDLDFKEKTTGHARTGSRYHDAPTIPPTTGKTNLPDQPPPSSEHTLTSITAFDTRLAALETSLGLSSLDPTSDSLSTPLLPTLTLLDQQLSALSTGTSLSALEAASSRIQKLKSEAAQLSHLQTQRSIPPSTAASDDGEDTDATEHTTNASTLLNPTDLQTLHALQTLLPTLTSLSPLVPALTTRLRSLRTLHATAATAASDLDGMEKRQVEMEKEIQMWREGLEKVEQAVEEADRANGRNGEVVGRWVEELKGRMERLGR